MLDKQYELKNLLDKNGDVTDMAQAQVQAELALQVMEYFLGCGFEIHGEKFYFTNLELYYGGIGDMAHDWYKANFKEKYNKSVRPSKECAKIQFLKGPKFYFNHQKFQDRTRCDIVIGTEGVPVSFLVRNIVDENLNLVYEAKNEKDATNGKTSAIIQAANLTGEDLGRDLNFLDSRAEIVKQDMETIKEKRFIAGKGFSGFNDGSPWDQALWNLSITKYFL